MTANATTDMTDHSGQSASPWMDADLPAFSALAESQTADVCIVGAGIAGLTTAYLLGRAGRTVIVLDDGPIVSGESERTTAHLTVALDSRYSELAWLHGEEGARMIAASHATAIDEIERIVRDERIACDFERLDGYLFGPPDGDDAKLNTELSALHLAGVADATLAANAPTGALFIGKAIRLPRQAQFHPLKYLAALSKAIVRDGGRIFTHTHATSITGGETARVETKNGAVVTSQSVVVATNTPVNDLLAIHTKQAAYRTFVIGAVVPSCSVPKALYWDTEDPYHYVRVQSLAPDAANDLLIVGGEDHKTGQADDTEERYARLVAWAGKRFPMITDIRFSWSGQVVEPVDGLAFIGCNPMDKPNVYVATGFSGNGMTYGTIAGMLLTDLIQGRTNGWASLYDPSRVTLRAAKRFTQEALNMTAQYGAWFTPGDVKDDALVAAHGGAVVRRGLNKVAVYCDAAGQLHECSAVCPHLGGIVAWNHAEETWDCPCHGSRFDKFGKVLNGPAITDLTEVAVPSM